jgi:hypothetical protein
VAPGPLRIDPSETAAVFTVPLATIVSELHDGMVDYASIRIETTLLDYEGRRIWGLTGRVLRVFVDAWNDEACEIRTALRRRLHL